MHSTQNLGGGTHWKEKTRNLADWSWNQITHPEQIVEFNYVSVLDKKYTVDIKIPRLDTKEHGGSF